MIRGMLADQRSIQRHARPPGHGPMTGAVVHRSTPRQGDTAGVSQITWCRGTSSGRMALSRMTVEGVQMRQMREGHRHRVVIVGAGFGGLFAAKALRRADVDVTLINGTTYHLFQPLLYQVATGILPEGEVAPPIREVLKSQKNVDVRLGWVQDVDVHSRTLLVAGPGTTYTVPYDSLIFAAGSTQSYFGRDEFAEHAPGMK